jgi:cytidylate kinase
MVITLDGPAGSGKSTVAQQVAERLGYDFLDTGAMYRAIGLAALRREADLDNPRELEFVAQHAHIEFDWSRRPPGVILNGEPVGHLLRAGEPTRAASKVAKVPAIRRLLVEQQRRIGREHPNIVTEGRDQGSVVFPDARFKFYLDAEPSVRARRRAEQLRKRGEIVDFDEIHRQILERDERDRTRSDGPLVVPEGAVRIDTTSMTLDAVVELIVNTVRGGAAE